MGGFHSGYKPLSGTFNCVLAWSGCTVSRLSTFRTYYFVILRPNHFHALVLIIYPSVYTHLPPRSLAWCFLSFFSPPHALLPACSYLSLSCMSVLCRNYLAPHAFACCWFCCFGLAAAGAAGLLTVSCWFAAYGLVSGLVLLVCGCCAAATADLLLLVAWDRH